LRTLYHFTASFPFAIPFTFLFSIEYAVAFCFCSVMLDFDHVFTVYWDKGQFSPNPFTQWNLIQERIADMKQTKEQSVELFHLTELWLLLLLLGIYWPILIPIVGGSLFHLLLDFIENVLDKKKNMKVKRRILTVYQVKNKFHKTKSS